MGFVLLSPAIQPRRTDVTKYITTKCWSLPEDENDSQLKDPPEDTSSNSSSNRSGSIVENHPINSKIQTSATTDKEDNNNSNNNLLGSLLHNTDLLEVRLDATLCAIFVLARFLLYDLTLPRKEVPGMEIVDVVAVLDTFSSAGALAILWSIAGIGVGLFSERTTSESNVSNNNSSSSDFSLLLELFGTTAISVPLWIILEKVCHWPISAGLNDPTSLLQAMVLSSLGVLGTMLIGRTISRFLP